MAWNYCRFESLLPVILRKYAVAIKTNQSSTNFQQSIQQMAGQTITHAYKVV